jgi:hypothetical protein
MSNYYCPLSLSLHPIADFFDIEKYAKHKNMLRYSQVKFPKDILKKEILEEFFKIGLIVSHVVLFSKPTGRREEHAMMHTDINWDNNTKTWEKEIFGVNWELTDTETIISWWKTSRQEIYPDSIDSSISPEGIHYGSRYLLGTFEKTDTRLDSVINTKAPMLLRTNEPHTIDVLSNSLVQNRVALSIRFENKFNNWEEVITKFKPLIK